MIRAGSRRLDRRIHPGSHRRKRPGGGDTSPVLDYVHRKEHLRPGNQIEPLCGGGETFPAMLCAIAAARRTVHMETYIIRDDRIGQRFLAALVERAQAGVSVRLLYDAVGSFELPRSFVEALRAGGVRVAVYHPLAPWRPRFGINQRDHMKILVVDGEVGFTGGINIGDEYACPEEGGGGWYDMQARVAGSIVEDLGRLFARTWSRATGESIPPPGERPPAPPPPHMLAAVIDNFGIRNRSRKRIAYLHAIRAARSSICLMSAYFIPDIGLRRSLLVAAQRGVRVQVIVPAVSDVSIALYASRHLYPQLLRGGVRIHEWPTRMMHAKTGVIDGVWSTIGSYNLDHRSLFHNLEASVVVADASFGARMQRVFDDELANSREVTLAECLARPWLLRARQWFCHLWSYWL